MAAGADWERSSAGIWDWPEEGLWEGEVDDDIWCKGLGNVNGGDCGEVVCPSAVSIVRENRPVNKTARARLKPAREDYFEKCNFMKVF